MADQTQGTVLIVEDESELRFILAANLRAAGYAVLEAGDGAGAIDVATRERPDVIIMDVGLPGMDGVVATRMLRSESATEQIPVIMLTARSTPKDVVRGLEAGAQEYLAKPFDVTELLARVRTVHHLALAHRDLDRLNTRLEAEVCAKTQRLQILYEFMRDLHQAGSRDDILDLLIQCVQEAVDAKRISLF
ncbi:MAG: response regulator, partial [Phycisphaerae bacterium]